MEPERPLKERIWEFTKDISVKVSRKAEKHWKINTLRVEIASIKHRIKVKYRELGRFVFEAYKDDSLQEDVYQQDLQAQFDELKRLESEIAEREQRIEVLEIEMEDHGTEAEDVDVTPPPPPPEPVAEKEDPKGDEESTTGDEAPEKEEAKTKSKDKDAKED